MLEEIRSLGPPVEAIAGNMDDAALRRTLPMRRVVEVGEARIGMVHDAGPRVGREARLAAAFPDCHAVVYGHTHVPQVERRGKLWILNPGSPTERRTAASHAMLVLAIADETITPELIPLHP